MTCAIAFVLGGCAHAPAGPAPIIESRGNGVTALLSAPLEQAGEWTAVAFQELGIRLKEVEIDADGRTYLGMDKTMNVNATLKAEGQNQTRVDVTASGTEEGSGPTYTFKVMERIIRQQ